MKLPLPSDHKGILTRLVEERLVVVKPGNRCDITNLGAILLAKNLNQFDRLGRKTLRVIDTPPQSRNEALAALMRRMNICEERGSGIDKVIEAVESFQLPAPDFTTPLGFTKATLFAPRKLTQMDAQARIRACHQH